METFTRSLDEAALMLPCLGDAGTKDLAARYHRDMGLRLFLDRDRERATQAFAAARGIEPAYQFPETLIPKGHTVLALYEMLDASNPVKARVPDPVSGSLFFDGTAGNERPTAWPSLVQLVGVDGSVTANAYLFPSDPMLAYEAIPLPEGTSLATAKPITPRPWLIGGAECDHSPLKEPTRTLAIRV